MNPVHRAQSILKTHKEAAELALSTSPELFDMATVFRNEEKRARTLKLIAVELIHFRQSFALDPATIDEATFLRLVGCSGPHRKRLFAENWEHVKSMLQMVRDARAKETTL